LLQLAAIRCNWLQVTATSSHEKVQNAQNVRFGASGCKWARFGATGCDCVQSLQVAASGCNWLQLAATGCKTKAKG
jgi:hypothetical protein